MSEPNIPDYMAKWAAEAKRRREALPAKKAALLAALRAANVSRVEVNYDGEGDSGQVNDIHAYGPLGALYQTVPDIQVQLDPDGPPEPLAEALDSFAWDVLDVHHAGFENNDGGYGALLIDVGAGTVELDHNDRVIDVNNTVTEV